MVESNFQRTTILPSEKAFAYKMRLEAMNRQGQRSDLTCATPLHKSMKSRDIIGQEVGESRETVRKYIRLTELKPELLDLVDEGQIALRPAVELSYLPKEQQKDLCESIEMEQCTPTHAGRDSIGDPHNNGTAGCGEEAQGDKLPGTGN